jgi:hypothetical protein
MTGPDMIFASRGFMLGYAREMARMEETARLSIDYDLFGPRRLDRRKKKRLLRRAEDKAAAEFFVKHGKAA